MEGVLTKYLNLMRKTEFKQNRRIRVMKNQSGLFFVLPNLSLALHHLNYICELNRLELLHLFNILNILES